jgi:hypothetical protein
VIERRGINIVQTCQTFDQDGCLFELRSSISIEPGFENETAERNMIARRLRTLIPDEGQCPMQTTLSAFAYRRNGTRALRLMHEQKVKSGTAPPGYFALANLLQ